jgi:hypothetical protein
MKTKIIKKKKVSRVGRVSRLKNKKRSKLQWKGMGGAGARPEFVFSLGPLGPSRTSGSSGQSKQSPGPTRTSGQSGPPGAPRPSSYLSGGPPRPSSYLSGGPPRPSSYLSRGPSRQSARQSGPPRPEFVFSLEKGQLPKQKLFDLKTKTGNVVSIIEIGDSFFQIQYIYNNPQTSKKEKYYFTIELDNLGVDKLQYYIKTKKINSDPFDNKFFLGLNENTIVIKVLNTGGQYRSGSSYDFIDVYESKEIGMIPYEENVAEMFEHNRLRINVDFIDDKYKKIIPIPQIDKDISWLNSTCIDINEKNVDTRMMNKIDYFLELYNAGQITKDTKIFTCDDLNVDHTKLIIDEINEDGEQYVIIGYPDNKMKPYIDLYNKHTDEFKTIYEDHKTNFMQYIAELYNFIDKNTPKINTNSEALKTEIFKFYGKKDYYEIIINFYNNKLQKLGFTLENIANYDQLSDADKKQINDKFIEIYGIPYISDFQNKFKELHKIYCNNLAKNCINKPMMKINYIFFIFKKNKEGKYKDMYTPAIFNFRQLMHKHYPILKKLDQLIKKRLSKLYGIIEDENTEEYKLWYSHYNYGDIFHIKTEYIHTMSNFQHQAYKYKNSITLEEIIYMLSILDIDLINLRIDYQKKMVEFYEVVKPVLSNQDKIFIKNKCYIEPISYNELLEKEVIEDLTGFLDENTKILLIFTETGGIYNIIYKNGIDFYKIKLQANLCSIYNEIFENLYNIGTGEYINIFEQLISEYNRFYKPDVSQKTKPNLDLSKVHSIKGIDLYKVLEHRPINIKDYKNIIQYNPLLVRKITRMPETPSIDIRYMFQNEIFDITKIDTQELIIPNPYLYKPKMLYAKILGSTVYKKQLGDFMTTFLKKKDYTYLYESNDNTIISNYNNYNNDDKYVPITKIYFNANNSGYNLIIIREETKHVVWIVPMNAKSDPSINEPINETILSANLPIIPIIPKFLKHITDLDSSHIELLEFINGLIFTNSEFKNSKCYLNKGSITSSQSALHIHILKEEFYKSTFATLEQGNRLNSMVSLQYIINMLNLNADYYNNFNVDNIIHQIH